MSHKIFPGEYGPSQVDTSCDSIPAKSGVNLMKIFISFARLGNGNGKYGIYILHFLYTYSNAVYITSVQG